jgi:regulator of protease activity HflC (stomatin/prohibitin superfamily)
MLELLKSILMGTGLFVAHAATAILRAIQRLKWRLLAAALAVAAGYAAYQQPPMQTVERGEIGIRRNLLLGSVSAFPEGPVLVLPRLHRLRRHTLRDRIYKPVTDAATGTVSLQSAEGLTLGVELIVRYALDPNKILGVADTLPDDIGGEVVEPAVQGVIYKVLTRYTVKEIFSAKRAEIQQGIESELQPKLAAQLEVAAAYGINIAGFERDGRIQLCYDGEAFRRVLALPSSAEQRARAALALTRHECVDPALAPLDRQALDEWRADMLDQVDTAPLPATLKNRIHLRRAGVWASLAYERARRSQDAEAAAQRALQELAGVARPEIADDDRQAYTEAAVRVGASRWAAEKPAALSPRLSIAASPGDAGQTCVKLIDPQHDANHPLTQRCTYGIVWTSSVSVDPSASALALAVQPLDTWREIWLFRHNADGWTVNVLPPSSSDPDIGYAEFAGWVPGGKRMLSAREARVDGHWRRSFEVIALDSLNAERSASDPGLLSMFYRWQSPAWKAQTVSLR